MPIECYNKKYNLNVIIKNTNPPVKKYLEIFLKNDENTISLDLYKNPFQFPSQINILEIQRCLNDFFDYEEYCILNKEDDKNKECTELRKKKLNSPICNNLIKQFESNIESLIDENLSKYEFKNLDIDYYFNKIKEENIEDNDIDVFNEAQEEDFDYIDFEEQNEEEKSYFSNSNRKKKNNDDGEELENYYKQSRKDCVEYGLKSLKEDLIICTKYE